MLYISNSFWSLRLLIVATKWVKTLTKRSRSDLFSATKSRTGVSSLNFMEKQWSWWQFTSSTIGHEPWHFLDNKLKVSVECPWRISSISFRLIDVIPGKIKKSAVKDNNTNLVFTVFTSRASSSTIKPSYSFIGIIINS